MINKFDNFRNIEKTKSYNDGSRSLYESLLVPELIKTIEDWKLNEIDNCVLIGGGALSYYVKPRLTQDIDLLFLSEDEIPNSVNHFKKHRPHAFQHNITHVEIEVVTPSYINMRLEIAEKIFETAIISDGIKIASPSGLIVSKLNRFNRQDQADIEAILVTFKNAMDSNISSLIKMHNIDLYVFPLTELETERYLSIKNSL